MNLEQAALIADELVDALQPYCQRIAVAGSVRRRVFHPKDIELVYIPEVDHLTVDLFGATEAHDRIGTGLAKLRYDRVLDLDQEVKRNGPKYKRLRHRSGIVVELFAAERDNWGLIYALRTGPADFMQRVTRRRALGGAMPLFMRMRDGWLWRNEERLPTRTEEAFFDAIGIPCWPPEQREPRLITWHFHGKAEAL